MYTGGGMYAWRGQRVGGSRYVFSFLARFVRITYMIQTEQVASRLWCQCVMYE